jgi:hypothetical protein
LRRRREAGRPARSNERRRLSAGHRVGPGGSAPNGGDLRRAVSRQATDGEGRTLMDKVRRLLRPVRLPIPTRPHEARPPATAAATDGRSATAVDPDGLGPSSSSLQGRCTATRALGPWVRGAGVEPAVPKAPGLRPGAVPRRRPTEGDRCSGRAVARRRPSVPFAGDLFSCQGAIWTRRTKAFVQIGSSHSQGRRESNPVVGGFGGRPATGAPPLRVLSCALRSFRKSKKPLPCGSGSSGHGPVKVQFRPSRTPPWEGARRTLLGRRRRTM